MPNDTSVFVKIDEYKDIVDILNLTREKLRSAKIILDRINQLKAEENTELEKWQEELEEVERRVSYIDKTLLKEN